MFQSTNSIGKSGELLASTHLMQLGFNILERNWRYRRYEIDIIAEHQDVMVFVEVKYRSDNSHGNPQAFVSRKQQKRIIEAANHYLMDNDIDKEARFDIIAIDKSTGENKVEHIPDAFYPVL